MHSFLTTTSPEETALCKRLLPGVRWLTPLPLDDTVSLDQLADHDQYGGFWKVENSPANDEMDDDDSKHRQGQCINCDSHAAHTSIVFTCVCQTEFPCTLSCKRSQLPPSHAPTCAFLQLQREVLCCAQNKDVFYDTHVKQFCDPYRYYEVYHAVSRNAIRSLTRRATRYRVYLLGLFSSALSTESEESVTSYSTEVNTAWLAFKPVLPPIKRRKT